MSANPDAWWLEADEAATTTAKPTETEAQREQRLADANDGLSWAMHSIQQGTTALAVNLASALEQHTDALDYAALADTVAWLQARRTELAEAEAYVARELGRLEGCPDSITLTDGRRADVMKGKERKEWRHADWQRDVRLAVIRQAGLADTSVVNLDSGEEVDVQALLAQVQEVHGSSAPKAGAAGTDAKAPRAGLKALGLSPDDYCTSYPGPYSVRISAPETTQEN